MTCVGRGERVQSECVRVSQWCLYWYMVYAGGAVRRVCACSVKMWQLNGFSETLTLQCLQVRLQPCLWHVQMCQCTGALHQSLSGEGVLRGFGCSCVSGWCYFIGSVKYKY